MIISKKKIEDLIEQYFWDEIALYCAELVQTLDEDELLNAFPDELYDSAELDTIDRICVDSVDEEDESDTTYYLNVELHVEITIIGMRYFDREWHTGTSGMHTLGIIAGFFYDIEDDDCYDLSLEYEY